MAWSGFVRPRWNPVRVLEGAGLAVLSILAFQIVFGWPRAEEDQAAQAVRAGLAAVAAAKELSLQVHVGIASGTVVVGDIEASGRRQTGAIAGETPSRSLPSGGAGCSGFATATATIGAAAAAVIVRTDSARDVS